ncbi:hypothetical protein [Pleurocapsa sp. PCC 7319]|nr:hypothetical protein [Pleurocapsa sp. PCC 7319]
MTYEGEMQTSNVTAISFAGARSAIASFIHQYDDNQPSRTI